MKHLLYFIIILSSITACKTTQKQNSNSQTTTNNIEKTTNNTQKRDADLISLGFDFVAFGNEPFWTLRIDFDKSIAELETMGGKTNRFTIIGNKNNLVEELQFEGNSEALILNAKEEVCNDNMSGEGFAYSVNIDFKGNQYFGCGKYLAEDVGVGNVDLQLFSNWQLKDFNGKPIDIEQLPFISLNRKGNIINGFSSCNKFNGSFTLEANNIRFSRLALTRMMCEESIEVDFMMAMDQVRSYFIDGNYLVFLDSKQLEVLKFEKKVAE